MATQLKLVEEDKKAVDRQKALEAALAQIDRAFGKGSAMKLGSKETMQVEAISTGSLGLDIALGIGGSLIYFVDRWQGKHGAAAGAIGKPCESVIPGSLLREVVRTGRPILLDMQDTPKEPLVVMRLPIYDDAGAVIGAIGFALFDELHSLSPMLKRYLSMQEELASTRSLLRARQTKYNFAHFIGTSSASLEVKRRARRSASSDTRCADRSA